MLLYPTKQFSIIIGTFVTFKIILLLGEMVVS